MQRGSPSSVHAFKNSELKMSSELNSWRPKRKKGEAGFTLSIGEKVPTPQGEVTAYNVADSRPPSLRLPKIEPSILRPVHLTNHTWWKCEHLRWGYRNYPTPECIYMSFSWVLGYKTLRLWNTYKQTKDSLSYSWFKNDWPDFIYETRRIYLGWSGFYYRHTWNSLEGFLKIIQIYS